MGIEYCMEWNIARVGYINFNVADNHKTLVER